MIEYTRTPTTLTAVAAAVATAANERNGAIYVEKFPDGYRWSPAQPGGVYPLMRTVAAFLDVDYHRIIVGFRTVAGDDGRSYAILCEDPKDVVEPLDWALLEFGETDETTGKTKSSSPVGTDTVEQRIVDAIG
jgi:hypothetical protein